MVCKACGVFIQLSFLFLFFVVCWGKPVPPSSKINNQVVIGILDQPIINESGCNLSSLGTKYIPASYIKLVESTGARAVPIPFDAPYSTIRELFNSVNAIMFPGGDADFTPGTTFYNSAQLLFNLTIDANDRGDYFPLIGICQGMEMLTVMMANSNCKILNFDYDAENISMPLLFTPNAANSTLFGDMPPEIFHSLASQNVTFNAHDNGLPPENYWNSESLQYYVDVLSTNYDRNGKAFVSSYEGKKYPIWGIQFHPSRLAYEWKPYEDMNHSPQAIADMQFVGYALYFQARYNYHSFPSQQMLQKSLIYNYSPVYTAPMCSMFEQCYVWDYIE